jgi:hypothetical protein
LGLLPQVSARIRQELLKRAKEFNIRLEDVSIVNLTFGQEFTRAVEQKQIAQQDAERAKYIVEMVRPSFFLSVHFSIPSHRELQSADIRLFGLPFSMLRLG